MNKIKEQKDNKKESTLKKLWANSQYKAGIKLGFYFIFIVGVCIFISAFNGITNEPKIINNEPVTFGDMQNNLIKSEYEYTYEVLLNKERIIFEGIKGKDFETGYKKTANDVIEYYIDDSGVYRINMDIKTIDDTIFENIRTDYFDLNKLFKLFELIIPTISYHEEITTYTYEVNTSEEVSEIKVDINQEHIETIQIKTLNNEYIMNFNIVNN